MRNLRFPFPFFLLLLLLILLSVFSPNGDFGRFVEGGKRRIEITDDLDDVVDDEEDEAWKEWGKKKSSTPDLDLLPSELDKMELSQIQAEFMKRNTGPVFGFVKLQLGIRRSSDMVGEIAMKWTKILRSGSLGVRFTGVDMSTIMFNMVNGQDIEELKEFILSQPEAYEIKIGDRAFRRPGDPPLEEVIEKLRREKEKGGDASSKEDNEHVKEEL
ncbi:hypothetical protein SLE2022_180890 [Rubroshorea leprosula]